MIGYGNSMFLATHGILARTNAAVLPVNTVAPALSGTAQEGQTLTCSTGTWTGTPIITYTYQWKRNGSDIGSATNSTYTLVTADVGQSIKCTVTATNGAGSVNADSNTVVPIAAFSYLLDTYSGALGAYSFRKLSSTYTGNCIRVRRSSDNAEQNIGFVNNVLDTASLLAFVGAGNGSITTWYDQSGNGNNVSQSSGVQQPAIVTGGVLATRNGKTITNFDGSNDILVSGGIYQGAFPNSSIFAVFTQITVTGEDMVFGYGQTQQVQANRVAYLGGNSMGFSTWGRDYVGALNATDSNLFMYSAVQTGGTALIKKNNTADTGTGSLGGVPGNTGNGLYMNIGSLTGGLQANYYSNIQGCEFIFYPSAQTTNRTGIESNINSFYTLW